MNCIVTAGPTYEPLDQVRLMTNFSTGRLGSELATFLTDKGHRVTLLSGQQATWHGERRAAAVVLRGHRGAPAGLRRPVFDGPRGDAERVPGAQLQHERDPLGDLRTPA